MHTIISGTLLYNPVTRLRDSRFELCLRSFDNLRQTSIEIHVDSNNWYHTPVNLSKRVKARYNYSVIQQSQSIILLLSLTTNE